MTAELVNLNRVRKEKARQARSAEAEANRARFGRSKLEKAKALTEAEQAARHLDGHRRDDDKPGS